MSLWKRVSRGTKGVRIFYMKLTACLIHAIPKCCDDQLGDVSTPNHSPTAISGNPINQENSRKILASGCGTEVLHVYTYTWLIMWWQVGADSLLRYLLPPTIVKSKLHILLNRLFHLQKNPASCSSRWRVALPRGWYLVSCPIRLVLSYPMVRGRPPREPRSISSGLTPPLTTIMLPTSNEPTHPNNIYNILIYTYISK